LKIIKIVEKLKNRENHENLIFFYKISTFIENHSNHKKNQAWRRLAQDTPYKFRASPKKFRASSEQFRAVPSKPQKVPSKFRAVPSSSEHLPGSPWSRPPPHTLEIRKKNRKNMKT